MNESQLTKLYATSSMNDLVRDRSAEESFISRFQGREGYEDSVEDSYERLALIEAQITRLKEGDYDVPVPF